jgi:hypothetical protein
MSLGRQVTFQASVRAATAGYGARDISHGRATKLTIHPNDLPFPVVEPFSSARDRLVIRQ